MGEVSERKTYFFTCNQCHKKRRQSMSEEKAKRGLCRVCLHPKVLPGQKPLFEEDPLTLH